jgi:hypothetical protein
MVSFLLQSHARAWPSYTVIAQSGQQPPGLEGLTFGGFWIPDINASGQVVFCADLFGPGTDATNRYSIWAGTGDSLQLVARAGQNAIGIGGDAVHQLPNGPRISSDGYVTFTDTFKSSQPSGAEGCGNCGIWSGKPGSVNLVARVGAIAPGSHLPFGNLHYPVVSRFGRTTLDSWLRDTYAARDPFGLWTGPPGLLQAVALTGSPAPGVDSLFLGDYHPQFSTDDVGNVAFLWNLTGPGVTATNNLGIWMGPAAEPRLIARTGSVAPGTAETFTDLFGPALSRSGQVAFAASLSDFAPAVKGSVWLGAPGSLRLVAAANQHAPGTPTNVVFNSFDGPIPTDDGQVGFMASLAGPAVDSSNNLGVWVGLPDSLRLAARTGDPVSGIPASVLTNLEQLQVNSFGQACFFGTLAGPGIDESNSTGIWATDPAGHLVCLLRSGQQIDLGGGDVRVLGPFVSDNFFAPFNDVGQIVFSATFTDGTNALLVATVPEPAGLALLAVCAIGILRQRAMHQLDSSWARRGTAQNTTEITNRRRIQP